MKYKTITYQRVKNLGNYESERLEMTVELGDEDNVSESAQQLRQLVNNLLETVKPTTTNNEIDDF